jgi:hypothetical protein
MKRRPHQALNQQPPCTAEEPPAADRIGCRQVLSGLINDYYREAAYAVTRLVLPTNRVSGPLGLAEAFFRDRFGG